MQKVIFIICDGLADRPIPQLEGQTPLEAAQTFNLDKLANDGISGLMHPIGVGIRPGSDSAHLSIFGYSLQKHYAGRGLYECAGIGMEIRPGDVAFRANAGTIDARGYVVNRRAGRIASTRPVIDILGDIEIDGIKFLLQPGLSHRMGMILRGPGLSARVTDQDPYRVNSPRLMVRALDNTREAHFTASVLNKFTRIATEKLLAASFNAERQAEGNLPANTVLFRGASAHLAVPRFEERYGLRAACIAGGPLYRGIAKTLGMDLIPILPNDYITGKPDTNVKAKITKAIEALDTHDFIFVHIKAADNLAEDGDWEGKLRFIEKIDQALGDLVLREDILTVVTADHTTSSQLKMHTADPVPVTIRGQGIRLDDVREYSERECGRGRLGMITGQDLMPIVVDYLGMSKLYHPNW